MAVKIVTDSACDLPKDLIESHKIEVLPILVYVNDEEYLDSVTLSSDDLYRRMVEGASVKTAQIPLAHFMEAFDRMAQSQDDYIYMAFSSNLSGTYQTSLMALDNIKETYPDAKIQIVDTKCASLGLGLMVIEAAKLAAEGATSSEVMDYITSAMAVQEHVFSVDNLEYLFRGGRVSRAQATIGNILNIKPILNVQDGFLIPIDKVKGKKKRLQKLLDYLQEHGDKLSEQTIGIAHSVNLEDADYIQSQIETIFGSRHFVISQLGCAVGAHCGPGMISIFFKGKAES